MQIKPAFNKILCRIKLAAPLSDIIIPEKSGNIEARMPYCEVIACGPDCKVAKVGDKALIFHNNLVAYADPDAPNGPPVLMSSEDNILGFYIDSDEAITLN